VRPSSIVRHKPENPASAHFAYSAFVLIRISDFGFLSDFGFRISDFILTCAFTLVPRYGFHPYTFLSRAARIMPTGAGLPVQISRAFTPWYNNIPTPFAIRQPAFLAAVRNGVSEGR
jgi:hypothetical protein